jgi:DNA topoisomerase-1
VKYLFQEFREDRMANYLVIVESPAKTKTIGKFLGKNYKIEASMGHIRDLPKSTLGVDVDNNFIPKYISVKGRADLIKKLKKEAKSAKKVFLATDPDREGEAISWHLANILKIDSNEECRITFNEITSEAVKSAIKSPRKIDMDLVNAQQARRILDRIVGYKISPLLWKKVRKGLSAGRVQSVASRLICDREDEIDNFVSEEYWTIAAKLKKEKNTVIFEARYHGKGTKKTELANQEEVDKILKEIDGGKYKVTKVKIGIKKKSVPLPFITSTLQQDAARKLGYPTKKTMMIAQQLYEGIDIKGKGQIGLITYMRTDSVRIANEPREKTREFIKIKYGEEFVATDIKAVKNKLGAQDAHEAIRPSDIDFVPLSIKGSLTSDQFKLYKLIWERFVASQMSSAIYDTVNADIEVNRHTFKASGSKIKFKGFLSVYIEGKDEEIEENENAIPHLIEGEILEFMGIEPKQNFTQPPSRYTEATLVKALEEDGIGRPSTYSPTISTILARGYVIKEKKSLMPTELGRVVTNIMKKNFHNIVDIKFTAQMEKKLDEVEMGEREWEEILKEFYEPFKETLAKAEIEIEKIKLKDEETDVICDKCGRNMVIKMGRFGKFLACPGFPECRNAKAIVEEAGVNCPICGGKVLYKKSKKGKRYLGCENNPTCQFMTWDMPSTEKCPKCGSFLTKRNSGKKVIYKCSKDDCDYKLQTDKKEEPE